MQRTTSHLAATRSTLAILAAALAFSLPAPAVELPSPTPVLPANAAPPLIVVGFMGGRVSAGNLAHREALVTEDLRERYPQSIHAMLFANHDSAMALQSVLQQLDPKTNGHPTAAQKAAARIVIFGHSWGASEAINLARQLNQRGIPILLTIQVDSVQKPSEDDATIPPNVREAINFYQTEGLLHGRRLIHAADPAHTVILGNYESSYKANPVSLNGYPWFARTFMKPHIEIENDPAVWSQVEALIVARATPSPSVVTASLPLK